MMNDRKTDGPSHQMLAMRADSISSASTSDRQTSAVERSSRLAAGTAAALVRGGLRIRNTRYVYRAQRNKGPGTPRGLFASYARNVAYFSELLIEVNLVFRFEPRPLTTAMMASEMPAAIRPYSMAVAPD